MTALGRERAFMPKLKRSFIRICLYLVLFVFVFFFLFPFYYALVIASRTNATIFTSPPPLVPGDKLLDNFLKILGDSDFFRSILNSLIISVLATLVQVVFCTMTGYAFAKYDFKHKNLLFMIVIGTLLIPRFLNIIPVFQLMVWFKWVNTFLPMIIPTMFNAFGIFLMKQFIEGSIPDELIDAGRIDGLDVVQIIIRIVFPMQKAAIGVLAIIVFISSWNDFMTPYVMLTQKEVFAVSVQLQSMFNGIGGLGGWGMLMTANIIAMLPILAIYLVASRKIMENIMTGSLKA
jgi:ABC-type glycerol-3-phosphate transport system permease component